MTVGATIPLRSGDVSLGSITNCVDRACSHQARSPRGSSGGCDHTTGSRALQRSLALAYTSPSQQHAPPGPPQPGPAVRTGRSGEAELWLIRPAAVAAARTMWPAVGDAPAGLVASPLRSEPPAPAVSRLPSTAVSDAELERIVPERPGAAGLAVLSGALADALFDRAL